MFISITVAFLLITSLIKAQSEIIAIKAGKLIDVVNGVVLTNQIILIEGNRITDVRPFITIPRNARIIDLSKATVLPGLIDCHTHLGLLGPEDQADYYKDAIKKSSIDLAILVHRYAERTLKAGFTTVRDLGSQAYIDVALRNANNEGIIPGPRMVVAGFALTSTGGHADSNGFSPWLTTKEPSTFTGAADGVDAVRKKVRENIKYGATVIKVMASGGVLSEEEFVGGTQYTQEEMDAIVREATMWNKRVAAHAHGTDAIKIAVKAGVNSIEHGSLIDEEGIRLMKEYGTYLVADIYNDDYIVSEYTRLGYPEKIINKEREVGMRQRDNFQQAVKAGVKIGYGTDAGVYPHGWNAKQFHYMVKYGMTAMQAIQSATINAADLFGLKGEVGTLERGKIADIIAVSEDPLKDITRLEKIGFVMKDGALYKNEIGK